MAMGLIRLGTKPPLTVAPDLTVHAAALAMIDRNVSAAAVTDNDRLVGIITERDVLRQVVAARRDPTEVRVNQVMSSPAISVSLRTSVADAAAIMRENHIRHLTVLGADGKVAGILAQRYVLYDILDDLERNVGDLMAFVMTDGPGG
jgi:CBS domain-containing protein